MGFTIQNDPEVVEIQIEDSAFDGSVAAEFRRCAAEALKDGGSRVTVDCSAVDFIDSSGVGALLHVSNLVREDLRPVILKGVKPSVLSVLELVRVHRFFEIVPKG